VSKKPVNAIKGRQGFQKTGRAERGKVAPTSSAADAAVTYEEPGAGNPLERASAKWVELKSTVGGKEAKLIGSSAGGTMLLAGATAVTYATTGSFKPFLLVAAATSAATGIYRIKSALAAMRARRVWRDTIGDNIKCDSWTDFGSHMSNSGRDVEGIREFVSNIKADAEEHVSVCKSEDARNGTAEMSYDIDYTDSTHMLRVKYGDGSWTEHDMKTGHAIRRVLAPDTTGHGWETSTRVNGQWVDHWHSVD